MFIYLGKKPVLLTADSAQEFFKHWLIVALLSYVFCENSCVYTVVTREIQQCLPKRTFVNKWLCVRQSVALSDRSN